MGYNGFFRPYSNARNLTIASVYFETNNNLDPDATKIVDIGGEVSTILRDAAGRIAITLKKRYRKVLIPGHAVGGTTGNKISVSSIVEGPAAANVVKIDTYAAAGNAKADIAGLPVMLTLHLYN